MLTGTDYCSEPRRFQTHETSSSTAVASECDWCGRPVRRESARELVHRTDDGVEVVIVCAECELGSD